MNSLKAFAALLVWSTSHFAHAQSNLGELLDQGAKKMPGAAVKAWLLSGTLTGSSLTNGFPVEVRYKEDGSFTGSVAAPRGPVGIWGKWTLQDDGKLCAEIAAATRPDVQRTCVYFFSIAERYYVSESESDRGAKVGARVVKP